MIGVDYAILGILLISSFISLVRGFVKEALSLAGWIMAFWISLSFAVPLSKLLAASMEDPTLRLIIAFIVLFILTLIVSAVINFFASRLVQRTGLTGTDRFLGVIFGFLRGALLVSVLVLLAGLTTLPKEPWWDDSLMLFRFQAIAMWIRELLPADVAASFNF
ncbi:MAG: CvpA family protein [Gammaproteobacteria bacterium]|jgi:membrane protein required for colicin V production